MKHATLEHYRHHVDRRLRTRLILYVLISVVMVCLFVYHVATDHVNLVYPLAAIVLGFFLGWLISRSRSVSWDADSRKVISRIDIYGFVILAIYIISVGFREEIIAYFVNGSSILATTFAFAAGIMFGRVWGIHGKVSEVIAENLL